MKIASIIVLLVFIIMFVIVPIGLIIYFIACKFYIWLLDMLFFLIIKKIQNHF